MLYWICPECGLECSPAIRECPTCTAPSVGKLAAAVDPSTEFSLPLASLAPAAAIGFRAIPATHSPALRRPAEPIPSERRAVAFVRSELPFHNHGVPALADLVPPVGRSRQLRRISMVLEPLNYRPRPPVFLSYWLKPAAEPLSELAIRALQSSFNDRPAIILLAAPQDVVMAPAPVAGQCIGTEKTTFTAIAPDHVLRATSIGPQAPEPGGPTLPPQLRNLREHHNSSAPPNQTRGPLPTWIVSVLLAVVVLLGGGSLLQLLMSNREAKAAAVTSPATPASQAPLAQATVVEELPAAQPVEVAGVRIVTEPNKKPQVHYVVINHSTYEVTGMKIRIAVRSADAPAKGDPLFTVSGVVPSLGPNQSKEIRTDLDSSIKPTAIPDWRSLRTEVQIARQ